ncbi:MAG: hypothetical protein CMJ23_02340 [Phycisphaerae bacterium]|nr:hypothetical protein [Phycisphaerae bacterium]
MVGVIVGPTYDVAMTPTADVVLEQLLQHRSIRKFHHEPVPDDTLLKAIEAGQQAATSSNIQAYSVIRIREPQRLRRMVELTGGQQKVAECGGFLVICGDTRRHRLVASRSGKPHASNLETFMLATIDASLFAQNLVIALEAMGWGTCYIGGLRNDLAGVFELLKTPEGVWPLFGLCIGRPDQDPEIRPRLDPAAVFFDETYPDDATMLGRIDDYDARMGDWYQRQGIDSPGWVARMEKQFGQPQRTESARCYRRLGADFE